MTEGLISALNSVVIVISGFLPKFLGGILILFIGLIIASLLKDLVLIVFKYFKIGKWLSTLGLVREQDVHVWPNLLAELLRWTTIIIFLVSAVDIWGIPKVGEVLNQLLFFLPN